jgi:hypothetical protein
MIYDDGTEYTTTNSYISLFYYTIHQWCKFKITGGDFAFAAVQVRAQSGSITYNNEKIYPMLRLASDTDDTYQPYAKTNRELTESYPANKVMMSDGVTSVEEAVDELNTALTNETVLLNQLLTTTSTKYDLSGHIGDYMFIAFILEWYFNDTNDNMVVMPSSAFISNDYLLIPRKNDLSTQSYAKINMRGYQDGVNYIFAEGTEGVSIKVVGIIHK